MKNFFKAFAILVVLFLFVFVILKNPKENLTLLGLIICWGIIFAPIMVYIEKRNKSL